MHQIYMMAQLLLELLLSGHMDRGADGETWGEDDLALLLIGYLLLG